MDEGRDVERVPERFLTCSPLPLFLSLTLRVGSAVRALGLFYFFLRGTMTQRPVVSAPADNDDA